MPSGQHFSKLPFKLLLVAKDELPKMWVLRRVLMPMGAPEAMEFLIEKLKLSKNNHDFFIAMNG